MRHGSQWLWRAGPHLSSHWDPAWRKKLDRLLVSWKNWRGPCHQSSPGFHNNHQSHLQNMHWILSIYFKEKHLFSSPSQISSFVITRALHIGAEPFEKSSDFNILNLSWFCPKLKRRNGGPLNFLELHKVIMGSNPDQIPFFLSFFEIFNLILCNNTL